MSASGTPEERGPPEMVYGEAEAVAYHNNSRMQKVQADMARRCLELLELPEGRACRLLDIGCGSGLSSDVAAAEFPSERNPAGHVVTGVDIAPAMLAVHAEREAEGDALCLDAFDGFPFRNGSFDGAISVSVLQWGLHSYTSKQVPQRRLKKFFMSLYAVLARGARAVLQFYVQSGAQIEIITRAAMTAGFGANLVVENPESKKAKKYYLQLQAGEAVRPRAASSSAAAAAPMAGEEKAEMGAASSAPALMAAPEPGQVLFTIGSKAQRVRQDKRGKQARGVEWVLKKKERRRAQGKSTARESKYTARRRKPKF